MKVKNWIATRTIDSIQKIQAEIYFHFKALVDIKFSQKIFFTGLRNEVK